MPNSATLYLPLSTDVVVKGFTNAAYTQRITVTPASGSPMVFTGSGENNTLIGRGHFTTPSSWPSGDFTVTVTIDYSKDGGRTWLAPDVYTDSCYVQAYNLTVVIAEDMVDQDYNDSICMVSWPQRDAAANTQSAG
jgi:hypothetical protein